MAALTTSTIIAGGLALGGLTLSGYGMVKQQSAAKKAAQAAREQQELNTRQSRRAAIRERMIRSAEVTAAANAYGSANSTGFEGNIGSLGSQLGSGLGFSTQMSALSGDISRQSVRASRFGALAGFGGSLFSASGGFGSIWNAGGQLFGGISTPGGGGSGIRTDAAGRILGGI